MPDTAVWVLPQLVAGQAGAETLHNDALNIIDTMIGGLAVEDFDLNTPPGVPINGRAWKIGVAPTGVWVGNADKLAIYVDGWIFRTIPVGTMLYDKTASDLLIKKTDPDTWVTLHTGI